MPGHRSLISAKKRKNDEFYTYLSDIENEVLRYRKCFRGKVVFCNCDDPEESNFWKFFELNFDKLGIKKLISTHYDPDKPTYKLELARGAKKPVKTPLKQNGDFRSPECVEILRSCDVVVTNPPFSLFREYVAQLIEYEKEFLIIGSMNAVSYKEIFPLIKNNKLWLGYWSGGMDFMEPGGSIVHLGVACWFTNLPNKRRNEEIPLYKSYRGHEKEYPEYDNYDAIEVSKTGSIPMDYTGAMGVPISFLDRYNPEQFDIIGSDYEVKMGLLHLIKKGWAGKIDRGYINGRRKFARIIIRNKKPQKMETASA